MTCDIASNRAKRLLHTASQRLNTFDPVPELADALDQALPLPVGDSRYRGEPAPLQPSFTETAGRNFALNLRTGGPGESPRDSMNSAISTMSASVRRNFGPDALRWFEGRIEPARGNRALNWGGELSCAFDPAGMLDSAVTVEWGPGLMDGLPAPLMKLVHTALEVMPALRPALMTVRCGRRCGTQQLAFDIDFPLPLNDLLPLMTRLGLGHQHPSLMSATALILGARFTLPPGTAMVTLRPMRDGTELRLDVYLDLLPDAPSQIASLVRLGMTERPRSLRAFERWIHALTSDGFTGAGRFSVLSVRVRPDMAARVALHLRPAALEASDQAPAPATPPPAQAPVANGAPAEEETGMKHAYEQSEAFPVVRSRVRELLTRTPAFRALPAEQQRSLAHDMVKVAGYMVAGETGDNMPTAAALAGEIGGANLPRGIPRPGKTAGDKFQGAAGTAGVQNLADAIQSVDFPAFVGGLIDGVFTAIVDASIKQMEAYGELVKNVAKSVDQFMKDNVSTNQARDYLADRYPDHIAVDVDGDEPQARVQDDADDENLPDFFADLGLSVPMDDIDDDAVEEVLVPAARKRIAMDRQQLLATMVLMGINRIVVTDGRIQASVVFRLATKDVVSQSFTQTAEQAGGKYRRTRPGFWSWFRPSSTRSSEYGRFKVSTSQEEDSEAQSKLKVDLKGNVDIKFKSETFPLERMADILVVNEIQQKAPQAVTQPVEPPATPTPTP